MRAMKRNVLIIEDEPKCLTRLKAIVEKCELVNEVFCAENLDQAYACAMQETIDLFLVDIILTPSVPHDVSGVQFVEKIKQISKYKHVPIIFITSLIDQEMDAFHRLRCYDYIEKPFDDKDVYAVIESALDVPLKRPKNDINFPYRKDGVLYFINTSRIICAERVGTDLHVYTPNETIVIRYKSIASTLKDLPREYFMQCSRNALVNRKYIANVDRMNRFVTMENGKKLNVGSNIGKRFFKELGYDE